MEQLWLGALLKGISDPILDMGGRVPRSYWSLAVHMLSWGHFTTNWPHRGVEVQISVCDLTAPVADQLDHRQQACQSSFLIFWRWLDNNECVHNSIIPFYKKKTFLCNRRLNLLRKSTLFSWVLFWQRVFFVSSPGMACPDTMVPVSLHCVVWCPSWLRPAIIVYNYHIE